MGGGVEPAGGEVEADRGGGGFREPALTVGRELAVEHVGARRLAGVRDLTDERGEFLRQPGEDLFHLRGGGPRLVLVEQRVVGVVLVADRLRLLALQRQHLFEQRPEGREVVLGAGLLPRLLGEGGDAGEFLDEPLRDLRDAVVGVPQLADVGRLDGVGAWLGGFDGGEEFAEAGVGGLLVGEAGEERELVAAERGAGLGHVGLLVPAEDGGAGLE